MNKKGFTLIELLVVIAIIGILSAIILASLSSAQNQGKNAAIESQLAAMQEESQVYWNTNTYYANGTYAEGNCTATTPANMFTGDSNFVGAITDINANGGAVACIANASAWTMLAKLSTGTYWCVDSQGNSKSEPAASSSGPLISGC